MSAFQVTPAHLAAIVAGWDVCLNTRTTQARVSVTPGVHVGPTEGGVELVWSTFADANVRSLSAKYNDTCEPFAFDAKLYREAHTAWLKRFSAVSTVTPDMLARFAKLLACFEYQACESPDWMASDAARVVNQLRTHALTRLRGYSDGPWHILATSEI